MDTGNLLWYVLQLYTRYILCHVDEWIDLQHKENENLKTKVKTVEDENESLRRVNKELSEALEKYKRWIENVL